MNTANKISAEAGIQAFLRRFWIPAYAGMTQLRLFLKINLDKSEVTYNLCKSRER